MMALVQRNLNFQFKILALQISLIYCKIRVIIHVCDKKKSISPYLKPCMTSNLISKSEKKNVIHDNKHYPLHRPLWQQKEAEERGKESIRGCFFISCSHHSPGAVFTITNLLFSENPLGASTEEKRAVACHQRR